MRSFRYLLEPSWRPPSTVLSAVKSRVFGCCGKSALMGYRLRLFERRIWVNISRCCLPHQPAHSMHVVDEVGEADPGSRSSNADGADEQAHRPFLPREDVLDRRPHGRLRAFARPVRRGIGLPFGFLRWICERSRRLARNFSVDRER